MAPNSIGATTIEAMSQPQYHERPFTERIVSKLTGFEMEPRPCGGEPSTVRFRRCSLSFVREDHYIGRQERVANKVVEYEGREKEVAHPAAVFRTKTACHGAICQMLMEMLPAALIQCKCNDDAEEGGHWDKFVPAGLVERIVQSAAGGGSYVCDVWMHVEVTRVYSEALELLLLCEAVAMETSPDSARQLAQSAGDNCPICMEELADRVTGLPGCSHAFHRDCILEWFGKAPTCPCCRRDIVSACIVDE